MSKEFNVGDRVRLVKQLRYVKTAEPMPMLRPPDVVSLGEEGVILDRRPGGYWGVRFPKGAFLMETQDLEAVASSIDSEQAGNSPESSLSE
ncbi:regulatory protein SipA [Lyngbya aestuarii]|uniref:regulatory protein SipA n=1 Tax=Lyngbya aestuarii TaxID=118322 RepID=UPI00403DB46B